MNYILYALEDNKSLMSFLSVMIVIVFIGLFVLLIRAVLKEQKKFKEESDSYIEGLETKRELYANVTTYMNKSNVQEFSLLLVDVDKYDELADSFGKDEAEKMIRNLALHILDTLPNRVELSRIDTDKFMIFMKGEYDATNVTYLARKLLDLIAQPIKIFNETSINLTASIAIVYYPTHGRTIKQLEESLDIANYICKKNGGNQFKVYTADEGSSESANMQYYKQIKDGIKNKEFTLYYQPIINTENNKLFGVEGLLRWNHPELGVLSPYKFINIMEQSGDIKWVGEWGLEQLIKEYNECKKLNFQKEDFIFSLNLSPKQLLDEDLASEFSKIVKKYKLNASNIALEINEFAIFDKHETISRNLHNLKELGFKVAVDGYGLDLNGIKRIEELGIDIVKLDKEYMDPENDAFLKQKFVSMLVDLANNSNRKITIVAEGVEDTNAVKYANDLGIKVLQGYNYAKPLSEADLEKYLKKGDYSGTAPEIKEEPEENN